MTVALITLLALLALVIVLWMRDRRYLRWRIAHALWQARVEKAKAQRYRSQRKHVRYL